MIASLPIDYCRPSTVSLMSEVRSRRRRWRTFLFRPSDPERNMKSVFLIDDEEVIRDALGALFRSRAIVVQSFADGRAFLDAWRMHDLARVPACLLIDVRMPGMSELELFAQLKDVGLAAFHAAIFLTGHGDILMAVEAVESGAYDFSKSHFPTTVSSIACWRACIMSAAWLPRRCRAWTKCRRA